MSLSYSKTLHFPSEPMWLKYLLADLDLLVSIGQSDLANYYYEQEKDRINKALEMRNK